MNKEARKTMDDSNLGSTKTTYNIRSVTCPHYRFAKSKQWDITCIMTARLNSNVVAANPVAGVCDSRKKFQLWLESKGTLSGSHSTHAFKARAVQLARDRLWVCSGLTGTLQRLRDEKSSKSSTAPAVYASAPWHEAGGVSLTKIFPSRVPPNFLRGKAYGVGGSCSSYVWKLTPMCRTQWRENACLALQWWKEKEKSENKHEGRRLH